MTKKETYFDLGETLVDRNKSEGGVEFRIPGTDTYLTVVKSTSSLVRNGRIFLTRKYSSEFLAAQAADDTEALITLDSKIELELVHSYILRGWRNLVLNGEKIPYSLENAKTVVEASDTLESLIIGFSYDVDKFAAKDLELAIKN